MPIRTFSPTTESTETSISSPIMMLWLGLRVRTSIGCTLLVGHGHRARSPPVPPYGKHSVLSHRTRICRPQAPLGAPLDYAKARTASSIAATTDYAKTHPCSVRATLARLGSGPSDHALVSRAVMRSPYGS